MIAAEQQAAAVPAAGLSVPGVLAATWGVAGVVAVLVYAIWRLSGHVLVAAGMAGPLEWLGLLGNAVFMTWAEGIRGFQQRFAPRVAARALLLARRPEWLAGVLAPWFCAGFFRATAPVLRITWIGAALIVLAVFAVQSVPQPWRGILDAGVVSGLAWGSASHLWFGFRALRTGQFPASPDLPRR
jgi:hypothetical protein